MVHATRLTLRNPHQRLRWSELPPTPHLDANTSVEGTPPLTCRAVPRLHLSRTHPTTRRSRHRRKRNRAPNLSHRLANHPHTLPPPPPVPPPSPSLPAPPPSPA